MARGRAPNLSLPPTRALTQQRDYRARKAARIAYLEESNAELTKQVEELKAEMADLRDGKGRTGEVDKLITVRESLVLALSIVDKLLPAEASVAGEIKPAQPPDDKPGASRSFGGGSSMASSASPIGSGPGDLAQPGKRKRSATEVPTMNIGNGRGLSGLRRESYESEGGEGQMHGPPSGQAHAGPSNVRLGPGRQGNAMAGPSEHAAPPAPPIGYPTYAMPAPAHLSYALLPHVPGQGPPRSDVQPIANPGLGPNGNYVPHASSWQQTTYHTEYHAPPYPQHAELSRRVSMTPSPHPSQASTSGWNGQAHYNPQSYPGADFQGQRPTTPSDLSTSSQAHQPSPEPHGNRAIMVPRYDKSCCDGLFDCSGIPSSMRPVMHNITVSASANSAAASLSYERGAHPGATGNVQTWSTAPEAQPPDFASSQQSAPATWNGPAVGPPPSDNVSMPQAPGQDETIPTDKASFTPPQTQAPETADGQDGQNADDQKCCWGVIDCAPPATTTV